MRLEITTKRFNIPNQNEILKIARNSVVKVAVRLTAE